MYPSLTVVISTMYEDPPQLVAVGRDILDAHALAPVEIVFVVQISDSIKEDSCRRFLSEKLPEENARVVCCQGKGLARSRNCGISVARGDVILFGDTDCRYPESVVSRIQNAYARNPDAGFISFKGYDRQKGEPLKRYWKCERKHTLVSVMRVGSWEISVRRDRLLESGVRFDEEFGLGSQWPSGAENVFLSDFLRYGVSGRYVPECVVMTPQSNDRAMGCVVLASKGALLRRVWGIWGILIGIPFLLRRYRQGHLRQRFGRSVVCLYQGWWRYVPPNKRVESSPT